MISLAALERCYLSSLFSGGEIQDIELSGVYEPVHREIRRLREAGLVILSRGLVPGGEEAWDLHVPRQDAARYAEEIRGARRRLEAAESLKSAAENLAAGVPLGVTEGTLREQLDRMAESAGKAEIVSAAEMYRAEYRATEFIIRGMLPVGLTVLFGPPKCGKSWLLLLMADCLTTSFPLFKHEIPCRTPVLYFTLEDSVKRCKFRLTKLGSAWSDRLYFCETARRGSAGLLEAVRRTGARVVIIDTLGAYTGAVAENPDYNDYGMMTRTVRELKRIADTADVAVLFTHHSRKDAGGGGDWAAGAIGSQGIVGAVDAVWGLERKRGEDRARLQVTGRDISDTVISLRFDGGAWTVDGDGGGGGNGNGDRAGDL